MEPILTKAEIADLLTAIRAGKVSTENAEPGAPRPGRILHAREIDLFRTYQRPQESGEMRIPNLDIVLDTFARNFSTSLTNTLQRTFTVEREDISALNFQQSLQNLGNQGAVGIYSTDPLKYGCLFHFDTLLAFTLLEIMLGSPVSSETPTLERALTTIEMNILKGTMTGICSELQKAFRQVIALNPCLTKVENNFRLVNIVDAETEVLVTRFTIKLSGERCGQMRFIVPYLTLEPLREQFKAIVTIAQAAYNWSKFFAREALEMNSEVVARSGLVDMSIRSLLDLRPGDIIALNYNPDQPLTIVVEDQPKFLAIPGERNGKKAFHVTGRYHHHPGGIVHGSS